MTQLVMNLDVSFSSSHDGSVVALGSYVGHTLVYNLIDSTWPQVGDGVD